MTYAKLGDGDVHVFHRDDVYYYHSCCLSCKEAAKQGVYYINFKTDDPAKMLAHLKEHKAKGHSVPNKAIKAFDSIKQTGSLDKTYTKMLKQHKRKNRKR